jgi:hypothetical protein
VNCVVRESHQKSGGVENRNLCELTSSSEMPGMVVPMLLAVAGWTLNGAPYGSRQLINLSERPPHLHMKLKTASRPGVKGFASAKAKPRKKAPIVPLPPTVATVMAELEAGENSLERYLNPVHFEDPQTMSDISRRLQSGDVVVLRDAFRPEFAEMVHAELSAKDVAWELNEAYFPDGYGHRHHNVYDKSSWSARLNSTMEMFASAASAAFIEKLTGRDCSGTTTGAPSWYKTGDHSLPHTDWVGQRTVAYVWHLSKKWKPEWGGALYWAQHDHAIATYPASFNTLVLFSVTTRSAHFVTTVSPYHKGKRLTFNGWWQSSWLPSVKDERIEEVFSDPTAKEGITHTQLQAVTDMINDPWQNLPEAQKERLQELRKQLMDDFFPEDDGRTWAGIL